MFAFSATQIYFFFRKNESNEGKRYAIFAYIRGYNVVSNTNYNMSFVVIIASIIGLILLISYLKIDAFISFIIVSLVAGIALGIPIDAVPATINRGVGSIMESLTLIIIFGAMLGKLVAESGAAGRIASVMVGVFGTKHIQWGLMLTGFAVGIPLFYNIGFVLLIPIIFSVAFQYKFPPVYIGLPMLASLSVAHGFLPPHPSPVALVAQFGANMGLTLIYGLLIAIPAIVIAGPIFSQTLKQIQSGPISLFSAEQTPQAGRKSPNTWNSFLSATLPVFLLILFTLPEYLVSDLSTEWHARIAFIGSPTVVMLIAILIATYTLGIRQGRTMKEVMGIYAEAVKEIAGILLIIAGSGVFKQVMEQSGVSLQLAELLRQLPIHPLVLGWMMAAIIRGLIGSATVAALTAASVLIPLVSETGVNPNLMVLAIGAGSLMFSHVNDSGFWMFKEYFNISLKDTLRSWSLMEIIVSVVGICGVMLLNQFVGA